MKNLLLSLTFLMLLIVPEIYSQSEKPKNLLTLKNEIKNSDEENTVKLNINYQAEFKKKNAALAILYSLLLPGMGELYADSYSSGKYFTIAEGALWGVYIGVNTYANWQKDRYVSFAASNGGVSTEGKDDSYFSTISQYVDINQYNDQKALEREYSKIYKDPKYNWQWTEQDRKTYRSMWVSSEHAFNNRRFVVGALLLNRLASAVNAVRLVSAYNKRAASEMSWNVSFGIINRADVPSGLTLNFQKGF